MGFIPAWSFQCYLRVKNSHRMQVLPRALSLHGWQRFLCCEGQLAISSLWFVFSKSLGRRRQFVSKAASCKTCKGSTLQGFHHSCHPTFILPQSHRVDTVPPHCPHSSLQERSDKSVQTGLHPWELLKIRLIVHYRGFFSLEFMTAGL